MGTVIPHQREVILVPLVFLTMELAFLCKISAQASQNHQNGWEGSSLISWGTAVPTGKLVPVESSF